MAATAHQQRTSQPAARARVLYIAGTGRSGSTLIANLLGEAPGFFNAGEIRFLWQRGLLENRLCGCGTPFRECAVWRDVVATAFAERGVDIEKMRRFQREATRILGLPRLLTGDERTLQRRFPGYTEALSRLYAAIAEATGAQLIVDSSKLPSYARVLDLLPDVELFVLHVVRDPRAAAFSWLQHKQQPDRGFEGEMERQGALKSSLLWDLWNTLSRALWEGSQRYARIKYEDFAESPRETLTQALARLGLADADLPFVDGQTATLRPNHMVAGNPDRLKHGLTTIRPDTRWRSQLPPRERRRVAAVTMPLLPAYGYSPRVRRQSTGGASSIHVQSLPGLNRLLHRVRRHYLWARREGLWKVFEEDELNPPRRMARAVEAWRWRRANHISPGEAVPVFVFGLQRSGTNMLTRGLESNSAVEVHNENDRAAFARFQLRPPEVLQRLVRDSRHRYVLFKSLIDSDHAVDLLAAFPGARGVWVHRGFEGRTRSALAKFGDNNLQVLRRIAAGEDGGLWQARGLSAASRDLIRRFDYSSMTVESAAALFWYVRNRLYFDLGLDKRQDVLLVSYERLVRDPATEMARVATFLGMDIDERLHAHIRPRESPLRTPLELDPEIRRCCEQLESQLELAGVERAEVLAV